MATGPKKGLWDGKKVGSGPNNGGFDTYKVASGYASAIFTGDPVKLSSGNVILATNGADALGVFMGCHYTDANGVPQHKAYKAASLTSVDTIEAKVDTDPFKTYKCVADGTVAQVVPGNIYAVDFGTGSTSTGLSGLTVLVTPKQTGTTALPASGSTALVGNVTGLVNADTFTVKAASSASATTITILTATTRDQFMADLNAVPNIVATLDSTYHIVLRTSDGTGLVVADGAGTPLADSTILAAGTTVATVAANAGLVKVQSVIDTVNNVLEVTLVNNSNRDDG